MSASSSAISPTAHYTAYVWGRAGLSHPDLVTRQGRVLFESLRPLQVATRAVGGPSLESYLLARHRAIDSLLELAIEEGGVRSVIEVACGMSPRGWRFHRRYGDRITYIEADLPGMAARKREALERMGSLDEHHRVAVVNALRDEGPESLAAVAAELDHDHGLAIVTEGLLGYLDRTAVDGVWRRFARALSQFPAGVYTSDLHLGAVQTVHVRFFRVVLSAFVRGQVHLHFESAEQARAALLEAGFTRAGVRPAPDVIVARGEAPAQTGQGSDMAHILEASTK